MKKLVLILVIAAIFSSCTDDEKIVGFEFQFVPVISADVPSVFIMGDTYEIHVQYEQPTQCHAFAGFDYRKNGDNRTVAILNQIQEGAVGCEDLNGSVIIDKFFRFHVVDDGPFTFQFFTGEDPNGDPTWLEYTVPVM